MLLFGFITDIFKPDERKQAVVDSLVRYVTTEIPLTAFHPGLRSIKLIARKHNGLSFDLRQLEVTVKVVGRLNEGLIIVERGYQTERIYSLL